MRYGSVCSGIEAATQAWHPLGWEPAFFSEIEKFPRAVLEYRYPNVPLHGDFTTIGEKDYGAIDLLVGGTPCQSFSVAGLRKGMDDDRGNLALEFLKLAERKRPKWVVWENVPGVLSSNGGRDFGSFIGGLAECGYGTSYRILDAQHCRTLRHPRAVPQRRRRVFVVGCARGAWQKAAAVLFDTESLRGNPAPSRKAGEGTTSFTKQSLGEYRPLDVASTVSARDYKDATDLVACPPNNMAVVDKANRISGTLTQGFGARGVCMDSIADGAYLITENSQVRRLTPVECERLQGMEDNFTRIPWRGKPADQCPDGPRYRTLGNSMAVNCMAYIGERIDMYESI